MVMMFHYTYESGRGHDLEFFLDYEWVPAISMYFYAGVYLFFIISGFVISMSIREYARRRETTWRFLRARVLRLVPLFVFCVGLTSLVLVFLGRADQTVTVLQVLGNLTFFANSLNQPLIDGVYWTLQLEWEFYLAVAALLLMGFLPKHMLIFVFLWLYAIFASWMMGLGVANFNTVCHQQYGAFFSIGILIYELKRQPRKVEAYVLLFVAVIFAMEGVFQYSDTQPAYRKSTDPVVMAWVVLGLIWVTIGAVWWDKWPRKNLLVWLGGLSYPLYLVHGQIGYVFLEHVYMVEGIPDVAKVGMAMVLALSLATVLAVYVEPWLRAQLARVLPR